MKSILVLTSFLCIGSSFAQLSDVTIFSTDTHNIRFRIMKVVSVIIGFSVIFTACEGEESISIENYGLTLKKSLELGVDDFAIHKDRVVLHKASDISPLGEEELQLKIYFDEDDQLILIWKRRIKATQNRPKSDYNFHDCDEFWLNGTEVSDEDLSQLTDQNRNLEWIMDNRDYASIEYHYDLPTFCSKELLKNPEVGFRRAFAQKKFEVNSNLDTSFISSYILLNYLVYMDFKHKGLIVPEDTVYLVHRNSEKVEQLTYSDSKVQRFLRNW